MSGLVSNQPSGDAAIIQGFQSIGAKDAQMQQNEQVAVKKDALQDGQDEAINLFAKSGKEKPIETLKSRIQKLKESGEVPQKLDPVDALKEANDFNKRNPELSKDTLVGLLEELKNSDSKDDILRKVLKNFPDPTLASDALEFLLNTTKPPLQDEVLKAKDEFQEKMGREISAGRNISVQARQAAEVLGDKVASPTSLRDLYRQITGDQPDAPALFDQLSKRYKFNDLKKVTDFLLHSLGADMKSGGSSIERPLLQGLVTETRTLQAILGVYRFFKNRMNLLNNLFIRNGIPIPKEMTFETIAQQFMSLAADRYPSSAKVLVTPGRLGIEKWILAKIFMLSQMRDAVREVAMGLIYKTIQHRDDLYLAILEALEELEDELSELEDREEQEEDQDEEEEEEEGKDNKKTKKKAI